MTASEVAAMGAGFGAGLALAHLFFGPHLMVLFDLVIVLWFLGQWKKYRAKRNPPGGHPTGSRRGGAPLGRNDPGKMETEPMTTQEAL